MDCRYAVRKLIVARQQILAGSRWIVCRQPQGLSLPSLKKELSKSMRHILRRIGFYVFAIWVAITLDFFIPRLAPGNPVATIVGKMSLKGPVNPQMIQILQAQFGLDSKDPLWVQYFGYLNNILHGNLGVSLQYFPTPV